MQDIISKTIRYVEIMDQALKDKGDAREKLGARLVNLPSMILNDGLVPTLLFYYSKSDSEALAEAYSLLSGKTDTFNVRKMDEAAYGLSLAFTIKILNDMDTEIGEPHGPDAKPILEIFQKIRVKEAEYEAILIPVLIEARKLAEAIFKKQ